MAKLQRDLSEFVGLLISKKVEFLVVGGHAVAFHGYPRFTGDIDFLIRATPDQASRILEALEEFGFGGLGLSLDTLTTPGRVVMLGRPPSRIDLLTSISGVSFDEAWQTRAMGTLDGHAVSFLGRDALLRNKVASGRPKDLADLAVLGARMGLSEVDPAKGEE